MRVAWLIARKDLRVEWRTRVLLWQVVPFGLMALLLCGLAVGPNANVNRTLAPGLLYVVLILVAMLVVGRSAQLDAPRGTRASLLTLGIEPSAVYLGKVIAVTIELWLSAVVLLAGSVLFLHVSALEALTTLPLITLAVATMSCAGVLYGAVSLGSSSTNTLLPLLVLPAYAPILIAGERGFSSLLRHGPLARWTVILGIGAALYAAVGILLYGAIEES